MIPRAKFLSRYVDSVAEKVKSRWSLGWRDALACAIAAALAAASLNFSMQKQTQTNWCWAAVSASVGNYYGTGNWTQCGVASTQLDRNCCSQPGPSSAGSSATTMASPCGHAGRARTRCGSRRSAQA